MYNEQLVERAIVTGNLTADQVECLNTVGAFVDLGDTDITHTVDAPCPRPVVSAEPLNHHHPQYVLRVPESARSHGTAVLSCRSSLTVFSSSYFEIGCKGTEKLRIKNEE